MLFLKDFFGKELQIVLIQGVRNWNVPIESAPVAKLLNRVLGKKITHFTFVVAFLFLKKPLKTVTQVQCPTLRIPKWLNGSI